MSTTQATATATAVAAPAVACHGLVKRFDGVTAVDGVDLTIPTGRITALLGPSGCGKTTTLRMVAGFERPDEGRVELAGRLVASPDQQTPPERRRVGMVFQDHALFPHLTVAENVAYGLRHLPRADRRDVVDQALRLVELEGTRDRAPDELSGGQRQRVALARALAPSPDVILLDEPFSNLDAALRVQVREDVRRILRAAGATALFVTHDQEEALSLADEVAVMAEGRLHQLAVPRELYTRPATAFVARFVGDADLLPGVVVGPHRVRTAVGEISVLDRLDAGFADVVLRPETLRLRPAHDGPGTVTGVTYFGHDQLVQVELPDGTRVRSRQGPDADVAPGDRVTLEPTGPAVAFPAGPPDGRGA